MTAGGNECFTDFALQEYLAGRLDAGVRQELEAHLGTCVECRTATAALETEVRILRAALTPGSEPAPGTSFCDEALARYLDGALDEPSVQVLEHHLSRNPQLLSRLIALRQEVVKAREEAELGAPAQKPEPLGQILRMPKRLKPVVTVLPEKRTGEAGAS